MQPALELVGQTSSMLVLVLVASESNRHTLEEVVDELARVLNDPDGARELLLRARFPSEDIPIFDTPRVFWARVLRAAADGKTLGGVRAIVERATASFPGNEIFANYALTAQGASESAALLAADPVDSLAVSIQHRNIVHGSTTFGPTTASPPTLSEPRPLPTRRHTPVANNSVGHLHIDNLDEHSPSLASPTLQATEPQPQRGFNAWPLLPIISMVTLLLAGFVLYREVIDREPQVLNISACEIHVRDSANITSGWVYLDSGEVYEVTVVGSVLLRFRCPPDGTTGAIIVDAGSGEFYFWDNIALSAPTELSFPDARPGVPEGFEAAVQGEIRPRRARSAPDAHPMLDEPSRMTGPVGNAVNDEVNVEKTDKGGPTHKSHGSTSTTNSTKDSDRDPILSCDSPACILDPGKCLDCDDLSTLDIKNGFNSVRDSVRLCGMIHSAKSGEKVTVRVSVSGHTGSIMSITRLKPHADTALGNCVAEEAITARFKTFQRETKTFDYSFTM